MRSSQASDRRLPVEKLMIPLRASRFLAALLNRPQPASSNGTSAAGTGGPAAVFYTPPGAPAHTRCTALPPIGWPTRLHCFPPGDTATATTPAAPAPRV